MAILYLAGLYLVAGLLFAVPFLLKWIYSLDEAAHGSSWMFKLTILPGCIVFWPLLLKKVIDMKSNKV